MSGRTDILVLGGGLAGAAAATVLARGGREVTLVEREATPRHKVCGEFLSAEALDLLGQLGVDAETHGARAIHTVRLSSSSSRTVAEAGLPFPARSLTRRRLDAVLLRTAEEAGATVLRGQSVESLSTAEGKWQSTLSSGCSLTAGQVILATGKHDLRGFPRPGGVQGELVALKMYFQLRPEQTEALQDSVELHLHPQGYTGLQLVEEGVANLTALVRRRHLRQIGGWPGLVAELEATNPHAALRLRDARPLLDKPLANGAIPYGFVRQQALAPTLYAVGDQAAVIPSFTGDGMSMALYSGVQAARAILESEPATVFQAALRRQLRNQVGRATVLSRALVHPVLKPILMAGTRVWPRVLRHAATATRLPQGVLAT